MVNCTGIKVLARLIFSFIALNACFHAQGQSSDVIYIYELGEELFTDTLDIGPDFFVPDDFEFMDEEEMPRFSEELQRFIVPFRGKVVSKYGIRRGRMHTGTDIKLEQGDTVVAAYNGIVTRAQTYYGYGKMVVVSHAHGLETYYAHFSDILVRVGDTVSTGQSIGLGGRTGRATGTHLHFEIRQNGRAYNPEMIFDFENYTVKSDIEGKEMLADLVRAPRVTDRNHIIDMGDAPAQYIVRPGDSLWTISRRHQVTINELCELNNLTTKSILRIGMVLRLF
jgi:hypothetical protein